MYNMWFIWKVTEDINHKFFVNSEFGFVVDDEIEHFICENYNIAIKMICLDHGSGDFQLIYWYVLKVKIYWTGPQWDLLFS